ncbi:ABC transporter ATP-binding protein [Aureimonas sp. ME7]|uniref:ABC transporter ATP-binding protein n=1 Tax=Aureimonas sp. ME7 TaxID=2744252 RepID=UPI0015F4D8BF|nr:ABC transporter ATP-binding protein [Aureimonas sp. ME7]
MTILEARGLSLGYGPDTIIEALDVEIPANSVTVIVGPNGCGKSTLLRGLAGILPALRGEVLLAGRMLSSYRVAERARRLAFLPQSPLPPDGLTVEELVGRGRNPYRKPFGRWSRDDETVVRDAIAEAGMEALATCALNELSGGQRQRAWLALVLAQRTEVVLLDEPTTYLDIAHQIHVLDICRSLHETRARTVVAVLHDLNLACRYATHLIVMHDRRIVAQGPPAAVATVDLIRATFGVDCTIVADPLLGHPHIIPHRRTAGVDSAATGASA